MVIAAVLVPHVQALPHHDEQAGHEGGEEGGRGGEPEVVGRPKPTDGSDEDGPDQDQSEGVSVLHSTLEVEECSQELLQGVPIKSSP